MNSRSGFTIPMPKPGDGTKIFVNPDGSLSCSWDKPRMAMDAAPDFNGPIQDPQFDNGGDPDGPGLEDKVRELLTGKLDPADLDELVKLIMGAAAGDPAQPAPAAQDRRRRGMATDEIQRRISVGLARRAQATTAGLEKRFPALRGARVV